MRWPGLRPRRVEGSTRWMSVAELLLIVCSQASGDTPAHFVLGIIVMKPIRRIMPWNRWLIAATGASAAAMLVGGAQSLASAAAAVGSAPTADAGFERVVARRSYGYRARRAYGYVAPRLQRRPAIEYANPNVYRVGS